MSDSPTLTLTLSGPLLDLAKRSYEGYLVRWKLTPDVMPLEEYLQGFLSQHLEDELAYWANRNPRGT